MFENKKKLNAGPTKQKKSNNNNNYVLLKIKLINFLSNFMIPSIK